PLKPKQCPYAANFNDIDKVEADGSHKVVFTLKRPSVVFLYNLTLFPAFIVSPAAVKAAGDQFPVKPVGTGPYKLVKWDRDVRIVLERVIVVPVKSPQTAIEKLKKGEVHVVDHPTLADVKALAVDPNTKVDTEAGLTVSYLAFNLQRHPYSDPNFRKAVS